MGQAKTSELSRQDQIDKIRRACRMRESAMRQATLDARERGRQRAEEIMTRRREAAQIVLAGGAIPEATPEEKRRNERMAFGASQREEFRRRVDEAVEASESLRAEIFGEEEEDCDALPTTSSLSGRVPVEEHEKYPVNLIISTDIGSDIDDALALLQCLHLPLEHVTVLGLITEFGWVGIRRRVAQTVVDAYNAQHPERQRIFPCIAGDDDPLFAKDEFWWHTNYEGISVLEKDEIDHLRENPFADNEREAAVDFLVETIRSNDPKSVTLLCIGSLLNVAKAFRKDPGLPDLINRIVFMGLGTVVHHTRAQTSFELGKRYHIPHTNHNSRQDMGAAIEVFASSVRIHCIGHTVTNDFWYENDSTKALRCHGDAEVGLQEVVKTGALLQVWLDHRSNIFIEDVHGTCPHDPLCLTEAVYPNSFIKYVRGVMCISPDDSCTFVFDPVNGRHFIGVNIRGGWQSEKENDFVTFLSRCLLEPVDKDWVEEFFRTVDEHEAESQRRNEVKGVDWEKIKNPKD